MGYGNFQCFQYFIQYNLFGFLHLSNYADNYVDKLHKAHKHVKLYQTLTKMVRIIVEISLWLG